MAKQTKTYSIDSKLAEKLSKEKNQSMILNDLIQEYYNKIEGETIETIKKKINEKELSISKQKKEIKSLKQKMVIIEKKEIKLTKTKNSITSKKETIKKKREKERNRAREFDIYCEKNKIKLPKLEFHVLMHKYSEETNEDLKTFTKKFKELKKQNG